MTGDFAHDHEVGGQGPHAEGPHQRRHARTTPSEAREFGAEGIGLCRTEHMFFDGDRIDAMREMILAETTRGPREGRSRSCCRTRATTSSASSRRWTACRSRSACSTRRCTSSCRTTRRARRRWPRRWASRSSKVQAARRASCTRSTRCSASAAAACAIAYPEIVEMQVRAIIEAAIECKKEGIKVLPEIMIPLVGTKKELDYLPQESPSETAERGDEGGRARRSST